MVHIPKDLSEQESVYLSLQGRASQGTVPEAEPLVFEIQSRSSMTSIDSTLPGKGKGRMDPYGRHHSASSVCVKVVCKVTLADAT